MVEYYGDIELDEDGVPVDAFPGCGGELLLVDPQDKKERKKGFNFEENSYFSGICKLGSNQIIDCYSSERVWHKKTYNILDLSYQCRKCKYYSGPQRFEQGWERRHIAYSIFHPLYIINRFGKFISQELPSDYESDTPNPEYDRAGGKVYFISDGTYIKIGSAIDTGKRLSALQGANPNKLYVLYEIPCKTARDSRDLEKGLHIIYRGFRWRGEWFNLMQHLEHREFRNEFPSCYKGRTEYVLPNGDIGTFWE